MAAYSDMSGRLGVVAEESLGTLSLAMFGWGDILRRVQGLALDMFGLGPVECSYRVIASQPSWRLRRYDGADARWPLLIVAAPIKRPYIWDLTPTTSVIRRLIRRGMHVHLLEWCPPSSRDPAGLEVYADRAIAACVGRISRESGTAPFLMGHSLGGTLATMYAALEPERVRGLVLIGAPVCFPPASAGCADAAAISSPLTVTHSALIPGSAVSFLSALGWPQIFIWSRIEDSLLSAINPRAAVRCARVERWALDEVALPEVLLRQVAEWLYRENRLCRGTLRLRGMTVGPAAVRVPTFAVVNVADGLAPRASVAPFLDRMVHRDVSLVEFAGEAGVGLQHLALLIGPRAHEEVWPAIELWLEGHAQESDWRVPPISVWTPRSATRAARGQRSPTVRMA